MRTLLPRVYYFFHPLWSMLSFEWDLLDVQGNYDENMPLPMGTLRTPMVLTVLPKSPPPERGSTERHRPINPVTSDDVCARITWPPAIEMQTDAPACNSKRQCLCPASLFSQRSIHSNHIDPEPWPGKARWAWDDVGGDFSQVGPNCVKTKKTLSTCTTTKSRLNCI